MGWDKTMFGMTRHMPNVATNMQNQSSEIEFEILET